mmetsp:Transcript_17202/g.35492  ORF Transcript_17202/g.35492 Transcript_17202/m.35492 type:complete len:243 (+) Transcript_17202:207-935(+)
MNVAASNASKRKASGLTELVHDLTNTVGDHEERIEKIEKNLDHDERIEKIEEHLARLSKILAANKKPKPPDTDEEEEEDLSDDDETVVDDSEEWKSKYRELREYRIFHGDCLVPRQYKENPKLGRWISNERTYYNNAKPGKKGTKTAPERQFQLERIGFSWGKKYPSPLSWAEMYDKVVEWREKTGNCNIPHHATNPSALAKWCAYQRAEYKRRMRGRDSLITLDQIGKLYEIEFKWKGPKL